MKLASNSFGAGVLLEARPEGYLWLTARHVIGEGLTHRRGDRALVAMTSGTWAGADVVGRHKNLDLCLLWLPREPGSVSFLQPEPSPNGASVSEAPGSAEDPWSQKISIS